MNLGTLYWVNKLATENPIVLYLSKSNLGTWTNKKYRRALRLPGGRGDLGERSESKNKVSARNKFHDFYVSAYSH